MGAERVTIKITKAHCLGGGRDVEIDHVMVAPGDLSVIEAETKVRMGYAVVVVDDQIPTTASPEETPDPEEELEDGASEDVETGDPAVETRDPASPTPNQPKPGGRRQGRGKK